MIQWGGRKRAAGPFHFQDAGPTGPVPLGLNPGAATWPSSSWPGPASPDLVVQFGPLGPTRAGPARPA